MYWLRLFSRDTGASRTRPSAVLQTWRVVATLAVLLAVGLPSASFAQDEERIFQWINEGKLDRARQALESVGTVGLRDGNRLFLQALLESDGATAAQMMEAALNTSVSPFFEQEIYYRLTQYYLLSNQYHRLNEAINQYRARWEDGRYRRQMLRFSVLADQAAERFESALRQADHYLVTFTDSVEPHWGQIDKARVMLAHNKRIGSRQVLEELSRSRSGPGVPLALYLLAVEAVGQGRHDDAALYYNMLREAYGPAVGQGRLVDLLAGSATPDQAGQSPALRSDDFYAVRVGLFSQEENARAMAARFRPHGYRVDVSEKVISGTSYRAVYVGEFATYREALAFKKRLEQEHDEVFQVVRR
jgi:AraC-like DNA-binding protein